MEMRVGAEKAHPMEMKVGLEKPSNNVVYGASILSILLSLLLLRKNPILSIFTGLWVPSIIGLGIFLKENRIIEFEKRRAAA